MTFPVDRVRSGLWIRLTLSIVPVGVGAAALVWPDVTVRVVGILFGLNLALTGFVRAALIMLMPAYPVPYRITAVCLGCLTAAVGVWCLLNVTASAILLVLAVGIGWLFAGTTDLVLGMAGDRDLLRGWRLGIGTAVVLASIAVMAWRSLTVDSFVAIGAAFLIVIGMAEALAGLLEHRRHSRLVVAADPADQP
jgi:uncharacterized membrane protein HdeD (DUF308 family)